MSKEQIVSPCIGWCKLNPQDICEGCGRTREERETWIILSDQDRLEVIDNAKKRLPSVLKNASKDY